MVLHNPNNWHWVNKDVREWAREYFDKNLVGIKAEEGEVSAEILKVKSMEGDVDVSQRKGKVITLFDVKVQLEYIGSTDDDDDVTGNITVPEVAHDTEEDEYVFEIDISDQSLAKQPIKDLVRKAIVPQLRKSLARLGPSLIEEHGKDIQHATGQAPSLPTTKVTTSSSINQSKFKSASNTTSSTGTTISSGPLVNTTTLNYTDEFRTTAEELYTTFTSPERLAAFTRSPPTVFEGVKAGGKFAIFGGNVSGSFETLEPPKKLVQKWRLSTWPEGHFSSLELVFDQNNEDQVTVLRVTHSFVPAGEEEVVRRNWENFYVRGIKTTFGFGTIL
ncbi:uncharacterized protein KY384_004363 [Bacidia gigantensis]|uniref:uncharacterized protein n=1 Tax=Bacidia gigantensis TaxID=2732470 RepID=UPI001D0443CE|nr:uncharacterized protein KY384_004363 [Bacidia gigantensis]KAG8531006.1 hypothetical protein KY384_004363 [Bacidia gigantensis]